MGRHSHRNLLPCLRAEHSITQYLKKACCGLGFQGSGPQIPKPEHLYSCRTTYSCRTWSLGTLEVTCEDRSLQKATLSQDCNSCRTKTAPRGTAVTILRALKPESETDLAAEAAEERQERILPNLKRESAPHRVPGSLLLGRGITY